MIRRCDLTPRVDDRKNASRRGYDARWQKERRRYLAEHPLCVSCRQKGFRVVATVVDHIIPHRGNQTLMWDKANNWQSLCKTCHDIKTGKGL